MGVGHWLSATAIFTAASLVAPDVPHAAVLLCHPAVSSGLQEARTEQEARALAISAWMTAASVHGQAYSAWRQAAGKFYNCIKTASGSYQCLAKAEPCGVSQVPPKPDGTWQPRKSQGISG